MRFLHFSPQTIIIVFYCTSNIFLFNSYNLWNILFNLYPTKWSIWLIEENINYFFCYSLLTGSCSQESQCRWNWLLWEWYECRASLYRLILSFIKLYFYGCCVYSTFSLFCYTIPWVAFRPMFYIQQRLWKCSKKFIASEFFPYNNTHRSQRMYWTQTEWMIVYV